MVSCCGAAFFSQCSGDQGAEGGSGEDQSDSSGADTATGRIGCSALLGVATRVPVGCRFAAARPGQLLPGALGQEQPGHPYQGDEHHIWREPCEHQVLGELGAHHHHDQYSQNDRALDDEDEAGRLVGQRPSFADTKRVQRDQDDCLDGDAAQYVADCDVKLAACCGAVGDGDFRQVRGHREQDQPAEGLPEVEPVGQDVGVVRQRDPGNPDRGRAAHEDQQLGPERHLRQQIRRATVGGHAGRAL